MKVVVLLVLSILWPRTAATEEVAPAGKWTPPQVTAAEERRGMEVFSSDYSERRMGMENVLSTIGLVGSGVAEGYTTLRRYNKEHRITVTPLPGGGSRVEDHFSFEGGLLMRHVLPHGPVAVHATKIATNLGVVVLTHKLRESRRKWCRVVGHLMPTVGAGGQLGLAANNQWGGQ